MASSALRGVRAPLILGLLLLFPVRVAAAPAPVGGGSGSNEATECLSIDRVVGSYSYLTNSCPYALQVTYCTEGGGQSACSRGHFVTEKYPASAGPGPLTETYGGNGIGLHFIACKDPYTASGVRYSGGQVTAQKCAW
jgi:hypothetical protein